MTLKYYFDDEEFEYDLDYGEISDYFEQLPDNQLIEYLEEEYANLSEKDKAELLNELLDDPKRNLIKKINGTNITFVPNFENLIEDDKSWCIDTFLYDNLDQYEDELKQYFEDEAREEASQGSDREEREAEYIDMITPAGDWIMKFKFKKLNEDLNKYTIAAYDSNNELIGYLNKFLPSKEMLGIVICVEDLAYARIFNSQGAARSYITRCNKYNYDIRLEEPGTRNLITSYGSKVGQPIEGCHLEVIELGV